MAITGYFQESSLSKSEIYGVFRAVGNPLEKAKHLIKNAQVLTSSDIESAYIQLKQYSNSLSRAAIKAYDSGEVTLLYNNVPSRSISQAFPFLTLFSKSSGKYMTYIFMDKYVSKTRDGRYQLSSVVLHDLLIGATISNKLSGNYSNLASNQYLQKILMEIYTKFVTRILNREYGLGADKLLFDSVRYLINRFFLEKIFETSDTPDNIHRLSLNQLKYIDEIQINEIKTMYETSKPESISGLLELIKPLSVRMNSLTLKLFTDKWISYYYPPATLAIDNIEYLMFMIIAILHGNGMISIAASDIVKETRSIKMIQEEIIKLLN